MMLLRGAGFLVLLVLVAEAKKYTEEQQQQWAEFQEYMKWRKLKEQPLLAGEYEGKHEDKDEHKNIDKDDKRPMDPPRPDQAALMARYIVNQADWSAVATISTRKEIASYPTAGVVSYGDGPIGNGSGIPYLYLTPLDFTAIDLAKDHRATLLMSLAQGEYCHSKEMDPMDPRCARVMLSGKIKAVRNDSSEHEVASKAFFGRHPKLAGMPPNHHFFLAKMKILSICVLDTFGGPKYVTVKDYLNPPVENATEAFLNLFPMKDVHVSHEQYKPLPNYMNPIVQAV